MPTWASLLKPPDLDDASVIAARWFSPLAAALLGCSLRAGEHTFRLMEIEFYHYSDRHPDPFAHRNPLQREQGRWYFHRTGGSYRSGSFKGLDLTFSSGATFGGILIRSMEAADGSVVAGPSLCVDRLLAAAGAATVARLDEGIAGKKAWDPEGPLVLGSPSSQIFRVFATARVGLSLKKVARSSQACRYLMQPYRYLVDPHRVRKGKLHVVLALHAQGLTPLEICKLTRCPGKAVLGYIEAYEIGRQQGDFEPYWGIDLGPAELCRLHGVWQTGRW